MARQSLITGQAVPMKTGVVLMARVLGIGPDNRRTPITKASISSIQWNAQDVLNAVSQSTGTCDPTQTVYDVLVQNDLAWQKDSANNPNPIDGLYGYNFRYVLPAAVLVAATTYQVDFNFVPVSGEPFRVSFRFDALQTYPDPTGVTGGSSGITGG